MTDPHDIPAAERETVRLVALDLPPEQVDRFVGRRDDTDDAAQAWPLRAALGADYIDPAHVEVIRPGDLEGVGLAGYLVEGLGVAEGDVAARADELRTLESGPLVVLRSPAWGGQAQRLAPRPPVRLAATFHEAPPETPPVALDTDSARPATSSVAEPTPHDPPPRQGRARVVVVIALLAAALVVLGLVLWLLGSAA